MMQQIIKHITPSSFTLLRTEVLAGLTVALALVPEAVSFSFVAGVHPLVGLYAAFIVGIITALIGGRPGMISGATGALAVV
ncbi:SulP family inorganic anion transporter, partial [Gammaproteobacteria bacterium]|nr:SulP family inorganic anion transporter [Gammaproteobacteria bacterium]